MNNSEQKIFLGQEGIGIGFWIRSWHLMYVSQSDILEEPQASSTLTYYCTARNSLWIIMLRNRPPLSASDLESCFLLESFLDSAAFSDQDLLRWL